MYANLTDMRNTANADVLAHRAAVTAAEVAAPAVTAYCPNSGRWPRARAYCSVAFVGGSTPAVTLRVWVRKRIAADEPLEMTGILQVPDMVNGQPATKEFTVSSLTAQAQGGKFVFDIPANGDDVYVQVLSVSGAPDSFSFNCWIGWRA